VVYKILLARKPEYLDAIGYMVTASGSIDPGIGFEYLAQLRTFCLAPLGKKFACAAQENLALHHKSNT
jgi:hypothetical protein